jgi:hypothetical protein
MTVTSLSRFFPPAASRPSSLLFAAGVLLVCLTCGSEFVRFVTGLLPGLNPAWFVLLTLRIVVVVLRGPRTRSLSAADSASSASSH